MAAPVTWVSVEEFTAMVERGIDTSNFAIDLELEPRRERRRIQFDREQDAAEQGVSLSDLDGGSCW